MPMYQHSLPDLETIAGTVKITLFSEFQTLNLPTGQTVVSIGDLEETADIDIGVTQLSTLSLSLKEDYSNYAEGFWYKVLAGECWLRFYLAENGINTFYFFGLPQEETIAWTEHFLGANEYLRTCELELVSMAFKMFDASTYDWVDVVLANDVATGYLVSNKPTKLIRPLGLFAAMLKSSGLNATYDLNDISYVWNGGPDFKYVQGGNDYRLDQIYCVTKKSDFEGQQAITSLYFSHSGAQTPKGLEYYYHKLGSLLPHLLKNFGLVLRMDYDPLADSGNGRHKIQLIQRGRAHSATLTFGSREKHSIITRSHDLIGDAVKAEQVSDSTRFCWFSRRYSDTPTTDEVPDFVEFDNTVATIFSLNDGGTQVENKLYWWSGVNGQEPLPITDVKYYKYGSSPAEVTASASSAKMQEAVAGYIYHRFTNTFTYVRRTYGKLKANNGSTDSHVNASILQRTNLNLDNAGSVPFYANRVKKSIERNELEIEWIKE